jgi:NAD-dependent SIR2 family protein deacetylase
VTQFSDFQSCDLLIVMGTTLKVYPFASLVSGVSDLTPRVLFNKEAVGPFVNAESSYRDVAALGDIDTQITELIRLLDWQEEFATIPETVKISF